MGRAAQSNYATAIADLLKADKRPLYVFAGESDTKEDLKFKAAEVLSNLGLDQRSIDWTSFDPSEREIPQSVILDDRFAVLLNKYYNAAALSGGQIKKSLECLGSMGDFDLGLGQREGAIIVHTG